MGLLPPSDPNHFTQSAICFTTLDAQATLIQDYTCSPSIAGRYVSLRIDGRAESLNIYEVEVYGPGEEEMEEGVCGAARRGRGGIPSRHRGCSRP